MNKFPRAALFVVTATSCIWLAFEMRNGHAQNQPDGDPKQRPAQSEIEELSADLLKRIGRAGHSITGEKPDPALKQDIRPFVRKLIDRLKTIDPASSDFVAGIGALEGLAFSAGQNDEFAKRLGLEDGREDLQKIDGLREVAMKAVNSSETSAQSAGARILGIVYRENADIERRLVELFRTTSSSATKNVAIFAISQGGFSTDEATAAIVLAIDDPGTARAAIRAIDEAGDVPPEAVQPLTNILKTASIIDTAGHAAEVLSKYRPERHDLDRLRELQGRIQDAEARVRTAIEKIEGKGN